jgi:hypothetical protein
MNRKSSFVCIVAFVAVGCASGDDKAEVLEAVKKDSAAWCYEKSKEGCEFAVGPSPNGWSVMALPILRSEDGQRVYVPGMFQTYSYSKEGQLLETMPGL